MKVNWTDEQTEAMKRLYGQFVRPGDLVFNIGAHSGVRTEVFVLLGAEVIAVEPQPQMADELRSRFWYLPVEVVQAAAGPTEGTIKLTIYPKMRSASCEPRWIDAGGGGKMRPADRWDSRLEVKQITLDSLIADYALPNFVKIDVDGYEREVLRGLSHKVPSLCFEATMVYVEPAIECLEDLIERLGFTEFNYLVQEKMELILPTWVSAQRMKEILRGLPESTFYCDVFAR